ncbi:MAG TPA: hypothetical protein VOA88_08415 [Candidatus Dormibacteraeota bacterium]|nr:hypothetical protein [Candidatus Dormibacteraeota bacterium]
MFLVPGKKYPIMQDNAVSEMHETGIYSIKRHDAVGKLVSTSFYEPSASGPISKGVVVEKKEQAPIN